MSPGSPLARASRNPSSSRREEAGGDRDSYRDRGTGSKASCPRGERRAGEALGVAFTPIPRVTAETRPPSPHPATCLSLEGFVGGEVGRRDGRPRRPLALKSQDRRRTFVARPGEGARAPSWTPGVSPPSASNLHWTRHHNAPGHVTVIAREGGSGLGDRPGSSSPRSSLNGRTFPHSLGSVPHCPAARRRQDTPQASRGAEVVAGGNA